MDVLKFFNVGEKVCVGLSGRKVFTIIGIQNPLPIFGGGKQTILIASGRKKKEVLPHEIREASIKPIVNRKPRAKKKKVEENVQQSDLSRESDTRHRTTLFQ